jgi:hypothetical protein
MDEFAGGASMDDSQPASLLCPPAEMADGQDHPPAVPSPEPLEQASAIGAGHPLASRAIARREPF